MVCLGLYKISTKLFLLKNHVNNLNQDLYIITYQGSVFYYKLGLNSIIKFHKNEAEPILLNTSN